MQEKNIENIPRGLYCYEILDADLDGGHISLKLCPYWSLKEDKPAQENGYCEYLGVGDWESEGLSLLWDQCKECQVNLDFDEYEF